MRHLPSGTVTLVFTDIEGSTRLLQMLGRERYVRALAAHRRLLRDAFGSRGGVEVEMQGDSFHFAFPSAGDAVAAAAAGQLALAQHAWESEPIRVRMGLHTGEPIQADGLYAGLDVHRAARVMSAGHGGQIVVSQRTAELAEDGLPEEVTLRDLGEHRLRDLSLPQRLYDLVVRGLPDAFPPPRTLENRPTNLPVQITPLVGREREERELDELLRRDDVRLVTLTGPGGSGKTRLALHVSANLVDAYDGVFFVALAAIREAALVVPTIARTLGVREQPDEPLPKTLGEHLRSRRLVLLLDNFEHLVGAATEVASLLASSRHLTLLVTSRERLGLSGEHDYRVPPLSLPPRAAPSDVRTLGQYEAVRLFIDRAQAVRRDFRVTNANAPAIAEICTRLDGLPLALELAAARIAVLTPEALLKRLERRLTILTGGARDRDERQQTLAAAIEWSYDLLTEYEQELFARLSVFAGGARLESIEAVLGTPGRDGSPLLDGVESLVAKSLLGRGEDPGGEPRLWMLETIREYALGRLAEDDEREAVCRRHAEHFVGVAEESERGLKGPGQLEWLRRLDSDRENLRAAIRFGLEHDVDVALRLVGSLWRFWWHGADTAEGLRSSAEALARSGGAPSARARALAAAAWLEAEVGDTRTAERLQAEALLLDDEVDRERRALTLAQHALTLFDLGETEAARSDAEDAVARARALGDRWTLAFGLGVCGIVSGDDATADSLMHESEALYLEVGDELFASVCRSNHAWHALVVRRYAEAAEQSLQIAEEARRSGETLKLVSSLNNAAQAELLRGRTSHAARHLRESLGILARSPAKRLSAEALVAGAALAALDGDAERSGRLLGAASGSLEHTGVGGSPIMERIEAELIEPMAVTRRDAFERGLERGRSLSTDEAIACALSGRTHAA